ncbi:hypothetical protein M0813_22880 [Anaeramoeba flamelloides]|uniref:Uncharacterized protein n=1 Tax=Anaeramoeba flamelloides TaxID=1746091 RepID=A0ABQ8YBX6_9EUKA|nr:hypothetical protein M0813_22880 [Anaeramoeba flamelloides]
MFFLEDLGEDYLINSDKDNGGDMNEMSDEEYQKYLMQIDQQEKELKENEKNKIKNASTKQKKEKDKEIVTEKFEELDQLENEQSQKNQNANDQETVKKNVIRSAPKRISELTKEIAELQRQYKKSVLGRKGYQKKLDHYEDIIKSKTGYIEEEKKNKAKIQLEKTNARLNQQTEKMETFYSQLRNQYDLLQQENT